MRSYIKKMHKVNIEQITFDCFFSIFFAWVFYTDLFQTS